MTSRAHRAPLRCVTSKILRPKIGLGLGDQECVAFTFAVGAHQVFAKQIARDSVRRTIEEGGIKDGAHIGCLCVVQWGTRAGLVVTASVQVHGPWCGSLAGLLPAPNFKERRRFETLVSSESPTLLHQHSDLGVPTPITSACHSNEAPNSATQHDYAVIRFDPSFVEQGLRCGKANRFQVTEGVLGEIHRSTVLDDLRGALLGQDQGKAGGDQELVRATAAFGERSDAGINPFSSVLRRAIRRFRNRTSRRQLTFGSMFGSFAIRFFCTACKCRIKSTIMRSAKRK